MKWIGQHIWDFISRFRTTVYIENLETSSEENVLVVDSDGKVTKNTTLGGSDITMTNGADNRVMTATGAAAITGEDQFNFYPDPLGLLNITSAISAKPWLSLVNSNADAVGSEFIFYKSDDGTNNDVLGNIVFKGKDGGGDDHSFATIVGSIAEASDGNEEGKLVLNVASHDGEIQPGLQIYSGNAEDVVDVNLGHGVASTTAIAGDLDIDGDNMTAAGALTFTPGGLFKTVAAGVEIENGSTTGAPALLIDNDDADQIALSIDATNTTADIISVTGNTLTSGSFINYTGVATGVNVNGLIDIDITNTDTTTTSATGISIDYNKSGVLAASQVSAFTGINIDYDDTATNNAAAIGIVIGASIALTNDSDQGVMSQTGLSIVCTGADASSTDGIAIRTPNDANDLKIQSSDGATDIFTIDTKDDGETTLTTVENGGGSTAHMNLVADGNIVATAAGTAELAGTTVTLDSAANVELEVGAATNYVQTTGIFRGGNIGVIKDDAIPVLPTDFNNSSSFRYPLNVGGTGAYVTASNTSADYFAQKVIPNGYTATGCVIKGIDVDADSDMRCYETDMGGSTASAVVGGVQLSGGAWTMSFTSNIVGNGSKVCTIYFNPADTIDRVYGGHITITKTT